MKSLTLYSARLRWVLMTVIAAVLMAPCLAHATDTTLFEDATEAINGMATDYKALLKVIFTGLVILAVVFALVRRGAKKAVN